MLQVDYRPRCSVLKPNTQQPNNKQQMKTRLFSLTKLVSNRLGFRDMCSLEEVAAAYPLLDVVDHDKRKKLVGIIHDDVVSCYSSIVTSACEAVIPGVIVCLSVCLSQLFLSNFTQKLLIGY